MTQLIHARHLSKLATLLFVLLLGTPQLRSEQTFRRGDTNADGIVDITDGVKTLDFLFLGGEGPSCLDAADSDDSGVIELTDASYTFSFLFLGGPQPPNPGLNCGKDPTTDFLSCAAQALCPIEVVFELPPDDVTKQPIEPHLSLSRGGALDVELSVISEIDLILPAGTTAEIETTNKTFGSDPVLHLMVANEPRVCERCVPLPFGGEFCVPYPCIDPGEEFTEIAVDDDSGTGFNARVVHSTTQNRLLRIVVRATGPETAGWCDLLLNGEPWQRRVEFGGAFVLLRSVRGGETLDTVRVPNGAGPNLVAYPLELDLLGMRNRFTGGGLDGGLSWELERSSAVVFGVSQSDMPGDVRVVRNDAALANHDRDEDGLGVELEDDLGLCSGLFGVKEGRIPDWRLDIIEARYVRLCDEQASSDEERDECVADYLDFLDQRIDTSFDCALATDPRDTDGDGLPDGAEVFGVKGQGSHPQNLPLWGADPRHKDMFVEVDFFLRLSDDEPLRMQPATARKFASFYQDDVGIFSSARRADHVGSLVNPDGLPGIDVHMDTGVQPELAEDSATYGDWGGYTVVTELLDEDGKGRGVLHNEWKENMHSNRLGLFRYLLPYAKGGGSNPIDHIASAGGLNSSWVLGHEAGHANGLHHYGPNHSELRGVNCKPNYVSLMNYAYSSGKVGFSDGQSAAPLNNTHLVEWEAVAPTETAYIENLRDTYKYYVDEENGHVDWNRDGKFAFPGQTVRAQANFKRGGSCEGTRFNAVRLPNNGGFLAPALARLQGRLYMFHSDDNRIRYNTSTSAWDCDHLLPEGEKCGTWNGAKNLSLRAERGVDAVRVGPDDDAELLVVANNAQGQISERRLTLDASANEHWSDVVAITGIREAVGEPCLARMSSCLTYLVYKDTFDRIVLKKHTRDSGWGADEIVSTAADGPLRMWENASPSIGRAYLAWQPDAPTLYGLFANEAGTPTLYGYYPLARRWEDTGLVETIAPKVSGRPAMAWVPDSLDVEKRGRLYIAFAAQEMDPDRIPDEQRRILTLIQSYVKVTENAQGELVKTPTIGLPAPLDNVWFHGYGVDFLYESGFDSNLRAGYTSASTKAGHNGSLWLRPVADGIIDYTFSDHDDWEALRVGVCKNVVNPTGELEDPIECPVGTWDVRDNKKGGDADRGKDTHDDEHDDDKQELLEFESEADLSNTESTVVPVVAIPENGGIIQLCPGDGPIFEG